MGTFCKTVVVDDLLKSCKQQIKVSLKHVDLGLKVKIGMDVKDVMN